MKISVIVNEINIRGGTHKQVLRLVEYLRRMHIDFELICRYYDEDKAYPEFRAFDIKYLVKRKTDYQYSLIRKFMNYKEQLQIFEMVDKNSTIVNIHDQGMPLTILFLKLFTRKKIVWQINDLPGEFLEGNARGLHDSFKRVIWRLYYRKLAKIVDKITVNVSKNKERVKNRLNRDANVFYCGTDIISNMRMHDRIQDKHHIHLISTGVFFPYRNYETLINVVDVLNRNEIESSLDIVGSTDLDPCYTEKIIGLIKEKKLERFIHIWGQLDEDDFGKIYDKADIFLFVNIDQSWGLAVFEAMGRGLPVIVSESVGAVELLKNNENALIVDPKNEKEIVEKICKLVKNDTFYSYISKYAMNSVERFTWDSLYCSKMVNLFENL